MKKFARRMVLIAGLAGGTAAPAWAGNYMRNAWNQGPDESGCSSCRTTYPIEAPNMVGPYGQPIPIRYGDGPPAAPNGADYAKAMLMRTLPPDVLQAYMQNGGDGRSGLQLTGGDPGVGIGVTPGLPPKPTFPALGGAGGMPGAVAAVGALTGAGPSPFSSTRTAVRFVSPAGMKISWYAPTADGKPNFTAQYLETPARYNFLQASIYRLKLSDIPNHPGLELYPTLEVVPAKAKTCTFLAHSAVPICFTEEDFDQVAAGNFVVKVIYLPDPQFQDLAATCPDEVVSSRLEPGVDPICEAQKRGSILLVVRLGNIDLEAPNTPPMDAPDPAMAARAPLPAAFQPGVPPGMAAGPGGMMMPGMLPPGMTQGPGRMVPFPLGDPQMGGMPPMLPPVPGSAPTVGAPSTGGGSPPPPPPATPVGKATTDATGNPVQAVKAESTEKKSSIFGNLFGGSR
jgi:hypothetical protein